jgi:ketosteroid isomerase-like protein
MSRENIELASRAMRAVSARPKPDFATVNEVFHPDHVFVPVQGQLEGEEYRGARGSQQFFRTSGVQGEASDAPLSWVATDLEGAVDVGNRKVLLVTNASYRGSASGIEFEQRNWVVMTVRDGRISRTEVYADPAAALQAVGLSEQEGYADS